jgi:hypothetical protein
MELAGLEPATSWCDTEGRVAASRRIFRWQAEIRPGKTCAARRSPDRIPADPWGSGTGARGSRARQFQLGENDRAVVQFLEPSPRG